MSLGTAIFVGGALVSTLGLLGSLYLQEKHGKERLVRARWLLWVAFGFLTGGVLFLWAGLLLSEFTNYYVFRFSSAELPLGYKVAALWAGQEGSYLFWGWLLFLLALVFMRGRWDSPFHRRVLGVVLVFGAGLLVTTVGLSPFVSIYQVEPDIPAGMVPRNGAGLNPLLRTPWMVVHPPVIFASFSAIAFVFGAGVVRLWWGFGEWERSVRVWARVSWVLLGLAVALGGLWSYEVLGWGGFWAWDPVETSVLLPWLVLTGYLHVSTVHRRDAGSFSRAAPLLACGSFLLVLYEVLVTRSGFFASIHAFGEAPSAPYLLGMLGGLGGLVLWLGLRRLRVPPPVANPRLSGERTLFTGVALVFVLLAVVSFWGITYPPLYQLVSGSRVALTKEFYNLWSFPLVFVMSLLLGFYLSNRDRRMLGVVGVAGGVFSLVAPTYSFTLVDPRSPFFDSLPPFYRFLAGLSVLGLLPPALYMALGLVERVRRLRGEKAGRRVRPDRGGGRLPREGSGRAELARRGSLVAVHLGGLLILLGAIGSSAFLGEEWVVVPHGEARLVGLGDVGVGVRGLEGEVVGGVVGSADLGGFRVWEVSTGKVNVLVAAQAENLSGGVRAGGPMRVFGNASLLVARGVERVERESPRFTQRVLLEVRRGGGSAVGAAEFEEDLRWGSSTRVFIARGLVEDVYVVFQGVMPEGVPLLVKRVPLASLVWLGIALLVGGLVALVWVERPRRGAIAPPAFPPWP